MKKKNSKRISFFRAGCVLASVVFTLLLYACGSPENATLSSQTSSAAPSVSGPAAAVIPTTVSAAPEASAEPSAAFIGQVICIADEYVNIREKADAGSQTAGTLPAGETAGVTEYTGEWAHISYNGITGYVSREYVVQKSAPESPVPMGGWASILVNPMNYLPEDFSVSLADFEGGQVDERILQICLEMFEAAGEDGVALQLVDAYRSRDLQSELYEKKVDSFLAKGLGRAEAEAEAAAITARPDTSEHQTGLALDIVTPSYTSRDKGFAETRAFQWLNANAQNYGFTLRYKKDKPDITKVIYEPWHWRFVGVQAAEDMKKTGECLEEYLGVLD